MCGRAFLIDNELITVTTEKVLSKCCQDTPHNPKNRCKYSTFFSKCLFPLNGADGLGSQVQQDAVDALDLVGDAVGDVVQ